MHDILVLGVYLTDKENYAPSIQAELQKSRDWAVDQRWIALGKTVPATDLQTLTVWHQKKTVPKFVILNRLLADINLAAYEYLLVVDDDIVLPEGFVDDYLSLVKRYNLAIAQPARTHESYIDHPFVERLDGITARRTRFVEIGPLFSIHGSAFHALLPFEEESPMGWGYDFIWPLLAMDQGLHMGIVDGVAVTHNLRPPVTNYDYKEASEVMGRFLARRPHLSKKDAFFIVESYADFYAEPLASSRTADPLLSVVICTYNRAELLARVLESLCRQSLPREQFEIVVINDGSTDDTEEIVRSFECKLPLRYLFQKNAGLASAKNHGLFASRGDFVLFLDDDDDVTTETLLEEHVKTHRKYPGVQYAVLGHTRLSPEIAVKPLMHFVVEVGCFLFSYPSLKHGDLVDYTYFWGGRSSCKRSLLLEHGVFNPVFRFGCEDIELGYRLSKQGLRVVYNEHAVSVMVRDIDFAGFCHRLERQGNSNYVFSRLHPVPEIVLWTETGDADGIWQKIGRQYEKIIKSAGCLDEIANQKLAYGFELDAATLGLLYRSYRAAFKACKVKGIIEKKRELGGS